MPSAGARPNCMAEWLEVEVVLAWPDRIERRHLRLPEGATVRAAAEASGLLEGVEGAGLAVYGREVGVDQPVEDGDRVEILRPLLEDPKSRRRRRAGR